MIRNILLVRLMSPAVHGQAYASRSCHAFNLCQKAIALVRSFTAFFFFKGKERGVQTTFAQLCRYTDSQASGRTWLASQPRLNLAGFAAEMLMQNSEDSKCSLETRVLPSERPFSESRLDQKLPKAVSPAFPTQHNELLGLCIILKSGTCRSLKCL